MASTGSIGMTRPMKKVTQVRPRKVSATEKSSLPTYRTGPASRRTRPSFAVAGNALLLRDGAIEVEILEETGLEAFHIGARGDLVGVLEHDHERAVIRDLLLQRGVFGLALLGVDLLGG